MSTGDLILGVDPGTRRCGFGVIRVSGDKLTHVDHGVIRLREDQPLHLRLGVLSTELQKLYAQFSIHTTVVEKVFLERMLIQPSNWDMRVESVSWLQHTPERNLRNTPQNM